MILHVFVAEISAELAVTWMSHVAQAIYLKDKGNCFIFTWI